MTRGLCSLLLIYRRGVAGVKENEAMQRGSSNVDQVSVATF